MKKINLIFGIHNHQPIGNFDHVFEKAFQKSYLPFLELVEKHTKIKIAYHNTGILYDWLEKHHPDFLTKIKNLTDRGQLELLTGGYYEPILSVIPDKDKVGQILKHKNYLMNRFNFESKGIWLAERIWEQHLVKSISETNIKFIVIDDTHFKYAGFKNESLTGYFITEEQGEFIYIFPINKKLRYTIPFRVIQETIQHLDSLASEDGNNILVFADDGEKFGLWPQTYESVYGEGWLDSFFSELEKNSDWINMIHFSDALENFSPLGLVYLPDASYAEMMHWSLPSSKSYCDYSNFEKILKDKGFYDDYNQFVRGGFWRNFMAKYPESNHLHKKMLRASRRAYKMLAKGEYIDKILDNIWMGQCNCPYWHGVFGGLYLPNLRSPIYKSLIQAENELDKLEKRTKIFSEVVDFNFDGKDEIIIETNKYNLYFYPGTGGALYELDYKPINFNLLDIVSRREEGYHKKLLQKDKEEQCEDKILMKEEGLESILFYDWYRHGSLIDHFFGDDTTLEKVYQCSYPEQGDFVNQPYKYHLNETLFENKSNFIPQISKEIKTLFNTNDNNRIALSLYRDGHIWLGNERYPINISKQILLDNDSEEIQFKYVLSNLGPKSKVSVWFGIEFNFGLLAGNAPDRYYVFPGFDLENGALNSKGVIKNCSTIELIDKWLGIKITISIDKPASVWRFPIETISMDVNYFEKVYQSSVVLPNWKIEMTDEFKIDLKQKIEYL